MIDSVLATAGADKIEQVILTGCSGIACVFSKALAEKHERFTRSVLNCHIHIQYKYNTTKKIIIGIGSIYSLSHYTLLELRVKICYHYHKTIHTTLVY